METQRQKSSAQRRSNIELLRVISMLMVLLVHADGGCLQLPSINGDLSTAGIRDVWRLSVESVAIIGVNCFTMISGYFGIKLSFKRIGRFLFQCLFYSLLIFLIFSALFPKVFSWEAFGRSFLVLSKTDLWYVPAYFALMLLSPVLNAGLESLSRRNYVIFLLLFVSFNLWCGWHWGGSFNPTGYTVVQLVMIYSIARFLSLHVDRDRIRGRRGWLIAVYFVSLACVFLSSLFLATNLAFAYNSPFVLVNSVSFFMLFLTFDFSSRIVNYAAKSAFAAYLIHKNPLVWVRIMKPEVIGAWGSMSLVFFSLYVVAVVIGFYLLAMVVDPLRRKFSSLLFG